MLSGSDILEYLPHINIIRYLDLFQYKSIEDAIGEQGLIILYPVDNNNSGHWCCMFNNPTDGKLYFFDSYGFIPDDQLSFKGNGYFYDDKAWFRYLTKLLYNSPKQIEYNQYQFQSSNPNVTTCGYWCIARLMMYRLTTEQFRYVFREGCNLDILVEEFCRNENMHKTFEALGF